jgi:hypothetical protein
VSDERGGGGESRRPRFLVLDPEPPPAARYQRIARSAAVTAVALALVVGLASLTSYLLSNHGHAPAAGPKPSVPVREASAAPPGRILSLTGTQYLALSDLRGDRAAQLTSLGRFSPAPAPTLDDRFIVSPYAQLIEFSARGRPGAWILCACPGANQAGRDWVVAAASGGPIVVTHGPGFPIAWLGEAE